MHPNISENMRNLNMCDSFDFLSKQHRQSYHACCIYMGLWYIVSDCNFNFNIVNVKSLIIQGQNSRDFPDIIIRSAFWESLEVSLKHESTNIRCVIWYFWRNRAMRKLQVHERRIRSEHDSDYRERDPGVVGLSAGGLHGGLLRQRPV